MKEVFIMKKRNFLVILTILVLALVVMISGCKKKVEPEIEGPLIEDEIEEVEEEEVEEATSEKIMEDFQEISKGQDAEEIVEFIDKNIDLLSKGEADRMVLSYIDLLEKMSEEPGDLLKDNTGELDDLGQGFIFFPVDKVDEIKDENLRKNVEKLIKEKFALLFNEGQYYPVVDYERFKVYSDYLSNELNDYISLMASITNEPMFMDGGISVSYDRLVSNILKAEEYVKKYHVGAKTDEVLDYYEWWLLVYLRGLENTPIYDLDTKIVKGDLLESFKRTALVKNSSTAFVTGKYISYIDQAKGKIDDSVLDRVPELVEEAVYLLDVSK